ncbi:hypothetical protein WJ61_21810 [Burkholderia ubonensis]|nr:hypothetical protein WJ61_21810 [Burkholderia ubonensis]OJA87137.1 hypothetical protein BGV49_11130 [Burkholderia ubonensis]
MGIKDDLAARNSDFISLRALLEAISAHEKVTLQEAADWLAERLRQADRSTDSDRNCPDWCEMLPGHGIRALGGRDRIADAWAALQHVVIHGTWGNEWEAMSDDIPF